MFTFYRKIKVKIKFYLIGGWVEKVPSSLIEGKKGVFSNKNLKKSLHYFAHVSVKACRLIPSKGSSAQQKRSQMQARSASAWLDVYGLEKNSKNAVARAACHSFYLCVDMKIN